MKHAAILAAGLALAACVTAPAGTGAVADSPLGPEPLELGDWRNTGEVATFEAFQRSVTTRYLAGLPIAAITDDLQRNEFTCGDAPPQDQGRGAPPAQVCRRTVTANNCTHTWQVHLFEEDASAALSHTRELYDRRCDGEGLLGGPG